MVEVKFICPRCGYAKKAKPLERIISILVTAITGVMMVYFIFGMIFFGPGKFLQLHMTVMMNYKAYKSDLNVREFALNITKAVPESCRGDDYCGTVMAYNYFVQEGLDYAYPAFGEIVYDPSYTLKTMSGDCKSLSTMFVSIMSNLGILASVDCDAAHEHCVAFVYPRDNPDYVVVDLTGPMLYKLDRHTRFWDWYDNVKANGGAVIEGTGVVTDG
jgi:hypothetical protein